MKRLSLLILVSLTLLTPATARADDGGFLDWLFRMDPKLVGIGTDIHLSCLDTNGTRLKCEDWFHNIWRVLNLKAPENTEIEFDKIRHQIDFRVAYYWKYGSRFSDVVDFGSIHAWKLMGQYHYQFNRKFQVGGGLGIMPFYGYNFDAFARGIFTPLSINISPWDNSTFFTRIEETYITKGFNGKTDYHNPSTTYATDGGEWNFSIAFGFDLRRLPLVPRAAGGR
jgi:hypothetical protein